jgi:hypothetical protein
MAAKRAKNGAGTLERRGSIWWLKVLRPLAPGETERRRGRIPIEGSEAMTEAQARRAAAKLAEDFRAGKILFDGRHRGAASAPAAVTTVRELGEAWTSGKLYEQFGAVNRLRIKATAQSDAWMLRSHVYPIRTRGATGPVFGDLLVSAVTTDDVTAVMAAHPKELRAKTRIDTY